MTSNTKAILLSFICFAIIFLIVRTILVAVFTFSNTIYAGIAAAVVASIFSPRRVIAYKQSGKVVMLKWFFSKKTIRIK